MISKSIRIILLAMLAAGCTGNKVEEQSVASLSPTDTVGYSLEVYQFNHPMYHATEFSMEYPLPDSTKFPALFAAYQKEIVQSLFTLTQGESNKTYQNVNDIKDYFFNDYSEFRKEYPESSGDWYLNKFATVLYNRNGIFTVQSGGSDYTGGAHGSHYVFNTCFDVATGEVFKMEQLFAPSSMQDLNMIGEKYFRMQQQIPDSLTLPEAGYFDSFIVAEYPGQFRVNNNFALLDSGIEFQYNSYEIGPYSMGSPSVLIPYSALKDILLPEVKKKLSRLLQKVD